MNLQEAIDSIRTANSRFPEEAVAFISGHKDEALPIMRDVVKETADHPENVNEDDMLHFFAPFFLGEFRDTDSFPDLNRLVSMPSDTLDLLYSDAITNGLPDILYCTFNGDLKLLKETGLNMKIEVYMRAGILDVLAQLYQDEKISGPELKDYIRQYLKLCEEDDPFIYGKLAEIISWSHFTDFIPDIQTMVKTDLIPDNDYSIYIDHMFHYPSEIPIQTSLNVSEYLRHWAMFDEDGGNDFPIEDLFEKALKDMVNPRAGEIGASASDTPAAAPRKIGRNDPCPCGSGKKYKNCCLNKPASPLDAIESPESRRIALKDYPDLGHERIPGRVYLADFFDTESIELDRTLCLGMRSFPLIGNARSIGIKRRIAYLTIAYQQFMKKVSKNNVRTFDEFDRKYSIHYLCSEWIDELYEIADPTLQTEIRRTRALMDK